MTKHKTPPLRVCRRGGGGRAGKEEENQYLCFDDIYFHKAVEAEYLVEATAEAMVVEATVEAMVKVLVEATMSRVVGMLVCLPCGWLSS